MPKETPASGAIDVLSEVLHVVRLSGVVHFRADFTQPWAILSSPPEILAARLVPGAESFTFFHILIDGSCWVSSDRFSPLKFDKGDVIVVPRGDQHVMTSELGIDPVPIRKIFLKPSVERVHYLEHGGGGTRSRFVCGFLHADQRFGPLLEALPVVMCVRQREGSVTLDSSGPDGTVTGPAIPADAARWWKMTLDYVVSEATSPRPGNRVVLSRLAELLFMEVLRWYMQHMTEGQRGWLAGLNDPQVGRGLVLLHAEPARQWTVAELARCVGISRALLARRFVEIVGESPMHYLAGWRIHVAKRLLQDGQLGVGEIAGRVGYESEAAFNRAFHRLVGMPPAAWRRSRIEKHRVDASSTDP